MGCYVHCHRQYRTEYCIHCVNDHVTQRGDTGIRKSRQENTENKYREVKRNWRQKVRSEFNQVQTKGLFLARIYFKKGRHLKIHDWKKFKRIKKYRWYCIFWLCSRQYVKLWVTRRVVCKVEKMELAVLFRNRPHNFKLANITNKWCREITLAGCPFAFMSCSV